MAEPKEITFVFIENFCGTETQSQMPFDGTMRVTLNESSAEAQSIRGVLAEILRKQGEIMRHGIFRVGIGK